MVDLAIWILIAFGVLAGIVRPAIQLIRTGRTGLILLPRGVGPVGWVSSILLTAGSALVVVSVIRVKRGSLHRIGALDVGVLHGLGIVLAVLGVLLVFLAQLRMGDSWRFGVNEAERTELVTGGWFSVVRNPIYAGIFAAIAGFALMVPTWLGFLGVGVLAVGLEVLVRAVEEPYLVRSHGDEYRSYASRVGRFLPGIGRLT